MHEKKEINADLFQSTEITQDSLRICENELQIHVREDKSLGDIDLESDLLSELLFDGIQLFLTDAEGRSNFRANEAKNWVKEHDPDYDYSFNNVCNKVGIDPDMLRLGLVNIANSSIGL